MKIALSLASLPLALAVLAAPAQATFPGKPGPLVYLKAESSETGGSGGLQMHGSRVSQKPVPLTSDSQDRDPAVSRNGRLVAFSREVPGPTPTTSRRAIFVMPIGGGAARQLTDGLHFDSAPAFSPNGRTVAFTRSGGLSSAPHIWAIGADGSGERQLTRGANSEYDPVFTPSGRRIVYVGNADKDARSDQSDIWAMAPNGADRRVLIDGVDDEFEPDVSPDGRLIVFASDRSHGPNLFLANAQGRRVRAVTHSKGDCFRGRCYLSPVFSPDGRHIASIDGGRYTDSLSVMKLAGSNRKTFDSGGTEEEGFGTSIVGPVAWGTVPR